MPAAGSTAYSPVGQTRVKRCNSSHMMPPRVLREAIRVVRGVPAPSLICVGDPRKGRSPLSFLLLVLVVAQAWGGGAVVRGQGGTPAAQRGRTTLMPAADSTAYSR